MTGQSRLFFGWYMTGIAFVFYGFGMAPAYYTWGFYGPEMIDDLGLSKTQIGSIFGAFSFVYHMVAPLAGMAVMRWGVRRMVSIAAFVASLGFFGVSRADRVWELYLTFSLLGGLGVGFGAILPAQALVTNWFRNYRSRAMAVVFTGGGLVSIAVNPMNHYMLSHGGWRAGWLLISAISFVVAVLSGLFVRNRPEDRGMLPDGEGPLAAPDSGDVSRPFPLSRSTAQSDEPNWTARQAIMTRHFVLITLAGIAYAAPWNAVVVHGRLHLQEELGYSAAFVATIFSIRLTANSIGRFASLAGDFVSPTRVLALALFIEAIGTGGLVFANNQVIALVSMILLGAGFGTAFVSIPLVFAHLFGRQAFAVTQGTSRMVLSITGYLVPTLVGLAADLTGTYTTSFIGVMILALIGAVAALRCPPTFSPGKAKAESS